MGDAPARGVSRRPLPHQLAEVDEVVFGRDTDQSAEGAVVAFGRRRTEVTHFPCMYAPEHESATGQAGDEGYGPGAKGVTPHGGGEATGGFSRRFAPDLRTNGIDKPNEYERAFLARDAASNFGDGHNEMGKPRYGRRRYRMSIVPRDGDLHGGFLR